MKTYNYILTEDSITNTIDILYLSSKTDVLIQVFCGVDGETLKKTMHELHLLLPNAVCIGTTTDGEIQEHHVSTKKTVISISVFEKTSINSTFVNTGNSFQDGVLLAHNLLEDNTKLIITFSDGTSTNGEEFLKGIESVNNKVMVAGGMAGDNGNFVQTFIAQGNNILQKGAVGISLNSDELTVQNNYSFNWSPIGLEHKIDKVEANRVYSIDGTTPMDFYAKYLGEDVANALPATGIEFPLIIEKNGMKVARAVLAKHPDGSLCFAGNLNVGDSVRLGFGNAEMIIDQSSDSLKKFYESSVETFFLYSCMARRRYIPELINVEVEPFASIAPTAGFFTYAEFFHHENKNELLNQTLTAIALSESKKHNIFHYNTTIKLSQEFSEYATTVKALTHLIQQSSQDLEEQAKRLDEQKQFSQKLLAQHKLFMRHTIHETITPLSVIMNNIELYELEHGKNNYLSNIEAAMKNVFNIYDDLSYLVKKNQREYPKHTIDLVDFVRNRIEFFEQLATQANLHFEFLPKVSSATLEFNETKLQRIIDNNLTNAIKYTKENAGIRVSIEKKSEGYLLQILSASIHIQNPEKIFEAYYREKSNAEGFGLGLSLVKQICEEQNVTIEVSSNEKTTSFSYLFKGEK